MKKKSHLLLIDRVIYYLELLLCAVLIIGIVVSIPDLVKYFIQIIVSKESLSYNLFQDFLSHVLLLVIGLEFILMLIAHTDTSIIYLITVVISRKMLIYGENTFDLLLGVIAIGILFAVKKYLIPSKIGTDINAGIFSAATEIDKINSRFNYNISDMGFNTIGGLVYYLISREGMEVQPGILISDAEYTYAIESAKNGIIEAVAIERK